MAVTVMRPVQPEGIERVVIIGDLNGNDEAFTRLLAKIGYTKKDALFILGNLVEEGPDSLRTLRHVMELAATNPVYTVLGDRDIICKELLRNDRNEELLRYVLSRKSGLIYDMCVNSNIELKPDTNMFFVKQSLRVLYEREIAFVCAMPHIIETEHFLFAHAQILPGRLEDMNPNEVIRADAFLDKGFSFDKYVFVGYWPVMLYNRFRRDSNPYIVHKRRIVCMNGGISQKRDGQLNAVIMREPDIRKAEFVYEDTLPKAKVMNSQPAGEYSHSITAADNVVIPLRVVDDFTYCKQDKTDRNFWIPTSFLTKKDGVTYSDDITDYQIPVTLGDVVSVIAATSRGYLIKKDGITGWYYGMMDTSGTFAG
ncbi:MAG: metallophosphoesterase [Lachnospiraceae bacterium]|nr:metallophosphoesterase [Lachnospiraceae bacterium]